MSIQPTSSEILAHEMPRRPSEQTPSDDQKASQKWIAPVAIGALVVGLVGLGVGAYALATTPAKTSGPQGPAGPQGAQGPAGRAGPAGAAGTSRTGRTGRQHRGHHDRQRDGPHVGY